MKEIKIFGSTLGETADVFRGSHLGKESITQEDKTKVWGRIIVSIILLSIAGWLLASDKNTNIASTIIGAIIGYWVK